MKTHKQTDSFNKMKNLRREISLAGGGKAESQIYKYINNSYIWLSPMRNTLLYNMLRSTETPLLFNEMIHEYIYINYKNKV